jgi:hypothetical protein
MLCFKLKLEAKIPATVTPCGPFGKNNLLQCLARHFTSLFILEIMQGKGISHWLSWRSGLAARGRRGTPWLSEGYYLAGAEQPRRQLCANYWRA